MIQNTMQHLTLRDLTGRWLQMDENGRWGKELIVERDFSGTYIDHLSGIEARASQVGFEWNEDNTVTLTVNGHSLWLWQPHEDRRGFALKETPGGDTVLHHLREDTAYPLQRSES